AISTPRTPRRRNRRFTSSAITSTAACEIGPSAGENRSGRESRWFSRPRCFVPIPGGGGLGQQLAAEGSGGEVLPDAGGGAGGVGQDHVFAWDMQLVLQLGDQLTQALDL